MDPKILMDDPEEGLVGTTAVRWFCIMLAMFLPVTGLFMTIMAGQVATHKERLLWGGFIVMVLTIPVIVIACIIYLLEYICRRMTRLEDMHIDICDRLEAIIQQLRSSALQKRIKELTG